ncbi:ATP-dependent DNA helicase MPH1 [Purpureocillium lavendulum]|uniref:ATP-dependent DNA helicase MPH1 n=1 Tax=Purpureocillium lavendulum TaxID=1247861 RepID=A0AB34G305_9HYPO|nr:ATP-dependent DNA helicase MPH1 [Purpureocillium lavendulum]
MAGRTTPGNYLEEADLSSDQESGYDLSDDDDDEDDETAPSVRSPTHLTYSLDKLSDESRQVVRDVFSEPPRIALQRCRRINNTYAFQMTELVTRSVRIRPRGGSSPGLSCTCGEDQNPCRHLVWLLDHVAKQTLYDHKGNEPLTMTNDGYAEEMGDPFQAIADCHLDVLADALHCKVVDPDMDDDVDTHRVLESRELLSSLHGAEPEDFRPDIFNYPRPGRKVLKRHDLDCTIFRMLLDNHHFFQYFLSQSRSTDPINDPFRKVSQRVVRVLRDFDEFSAARPTLSPEESPADVTWAARHLVGGVKRINSAIYTRDRPLEPHEALSAARTLVQILEAVVARNHDAPHGSESTRGSRNLYLCLVGDRDRGFVVDELDLLPEAASQFLHRLDALHDQIGVYGAPASYVEKLRALLSRLRTSTAGTGLKRQTQGSQDAPRGPKRMK